MSEVQPNEEQENNTKFVSATTLAGASIPLVEGAIAISHGGVIGGIVGLGVSGLVWLLADEMAKRGRGITLPAPSQQAEQRPSRSSLPGPIARMFTGKDDREQEAGQRELAPAEPAETRSRMQAQPGHLLLGATLQPYADQLLSKRLGMFGIPGSGKSNFVRVFVEELGKLDGIGVPFCLADTEGEYGHLCSLDYLTRPYRAHAGNVTTETAFAFGQEILQRGHQVVLDLMSYENDDDAALVMVGIIKGLRALAESFENEDRATCMFILDEASTWLPQNAQESILSKAVLQQVQQEFFRTVVRRGRKRGIGFTFATQRIAEIDKRACQCDWHFLFRQTGTNDIARYVELGVDKDVPPALAPGEALVKDPSDTKVVHALRKSYSPDNSVTPGRASLQKYAAQWGAPTAQAKETEPLAGSLPAPLAAGTQQPTGSEQMAVILLQNGFSLEEVTGILSSRSGNSRTQAGGAARSEMAGKGLPDLAAGNIPGDTEDLQNVLVEPFPEGETFFPASGKNEPALGSDDLKFTPEQEQDFLLRYQRSKLLVTSKRIEECLSNMVNNRGGIGLGKRYYKYARWLIEQQSEQITR